MSLLAENRPWKPELEQYRAIDIRCEDCGRSKRMQPGEIAHHIRRGVYTVMALHDRMLCRVCADRGVGGGKNISLFPIKRGE